MKTITYKKTEMVTKNKLEITHDHDTENPRKLADMLGHFVTSERDYFSPDEKDNRYHEAMVNTGENATSLKNHMELIEEEIGKETIRAIFPITRYEHSIIRYIRGNQEGFDYSIAGFYIVEKNEETKGMTNKQIENIIDNELETYNAWVNGEVYQYVLYNDEGDVEDACGGFYRLEDITEHLPKEWHEEDLNEYLIY